MNKYMTLLCNWVLWVTVIGFDRVASHRTSCPLSVGEAVTNRSPLLQYLKESYIPMSSDEPAGFPTSPDLNGVATSSSTGLAAPNHKRTYQVRGSRS